MNPYIHHTSFLLDDRTFSSMTKREIKHIAKEIGFNGTGLAEIEIIASELISNLNKHATSGKELLIKKITRGDVPGIEIISLDNGPGIAELDNAMKDGVSSTSTIGGGLGAIQRLSDEFEIFSQPPMGTIILSRCFTKKLPANNKEIVPSVIMVPKAGETVSGDGYAYKIMGNTFRLICLDGLGHGPEANRAVQEATTAFMEDTSPTPSDALIFIHDKIRKTRGAVATITDIDTKDNSIAYCGIGNLACKLTSGTTIKSFISYNGVMGMNRPTTMHTQHYQPNGPFTLVVTSDGIKSRWDTNKFTNISRYDPSIYAACIYKEFTRRTDDALVLALHIK